MPPADPIELNLLRPWREPITPRRFLRDAAGSFVVHALVALAISLAPAVEPYQEPATPTVAELQKSAIKITAPRFYEPTQKAPNEGKVTHTLDSASAQGSPAPRRYRPPSPVSGVPRPTAPIEPAQLDAPQLDSGQAAVPGLGAGFGGGIKAAAPAATPTTATIPGGIKAPQITAAPPAPPAPRPNTPGPAATARVNPPPAAAPGALRPPGSVSVGDVEIPQITGTNQAPSQCADQTCSGLQLLSDPQNVDFVPYLKQVLAVVKRNWLTVIPDAAKAGRRGVVVIKFFIQRNGSVSTLSITATSGSGAMDRAAVAGMSMSNPFPPLPAGYKGDEIHLQMAFSYNPVR